MAKLYLPRNAWIMLFILILMVLYGVVPSFQNSVNGVIGAFFGPIINMFALASSLG